MILAVDINILLDILIPNTKHVHSSLNCLLSLGISDKLIISEIVFAELAAQFLSFQDLKQFLDDTGITQRSLRPQPKGRKIATATIHPQCIPVSKTTEFAA